MQTLLENKIVVKKYDTYISSLKGLACIFVMMGHFLGMLKYSTSLVSVRNVFNFFETIHIGFIFNESFWLYLFFLISGFLCARTTINNFLSLVEKIIFRFLRLAIPILLCNTVIFLIYNVVGFHNAETSSIFYNIWFQGAYQEELSLLMLIKSPIDVLILSKCYFNSTYWVLRSMFISSILIYLLSYIFKHINGEKVKTLIIVLVMVAAYCLDKIIFSCLVGFILTYYREYIENDISERMLKGLFIFDLLIYFLTQSFIAMIVLFGLLIIVVPKINKANNFLSSKKMDYLGKISFGIYAFHWPLFCSVSSLLFIWLWGSLGLIAFLVTILFSIIITVLLSVLYYQFVEKYIFILLKKFQMLIHKKDKKKNEV